MYMIIHTKCHIPYQKQINYITQNIVNHHFSIRFFSCVVSKHGVWRLSDFLKTCMCHCVASKLHDVWCLSIEIQASAQHIQSIRIMIYVSDQIQQLISDMFITVNFTILSEVNHMMFPSTAMQ